MELPEIRAHGDLAHLLFDIGPTGPTGAPLSYADIDAANRVLQLDLSPWQAGQLRKLSREYVATAGDAVDPSMPPPYTSGVTDDRTREQVSDRFKEMAQRLKPRKGKVKK